MYDDILQATLVTVIQVLLPVVLGAVVILIKAGVDKLKAGMEKDQLELAEKLIRRLIQAAEQNGLIGALENVGEEKKAWVLEQLEAALYKRGIKLDLAEIDALVEAIVHEELNWLKDSKDEPGKDTVEPAGGVDEEIPPIGAA